MRTTFALLLALALPIQSLAASHAISSAQLTQGSLLGQIASTAELQRDFNSNGDLIAQASADLGLTHQDYLTVRRAIALGQARYVVIPRHLDAMAGQHDGRAFVVKNVTIPAGVYGWEVDLNEPDGIARVFVPNKCGNVSVLRVKHYRVAAARVTPPPVIAAAPLQAPPVAAETPAPVAVATAVPVAVLPPVAPVATGASHLGWLALLLVPVLLIAGGGGNHGGGGSGIRPANVVPTPTPVPIHTICPTFSVRISIPLPR